VRQAHTIALAREGILTVTQEIVIQGGLATIREVTVMQQLALRDVMPHIENRVPNTTPILPASTLVSHWDPTVQNEQKLHLLIQLPPKVRTINDRRTRAVARPTDDTYRVSVPWSLFDFRMTTSNPHTNVWDFAEYRIFHSPEEITSLDQEVLPAFLPNVYKDGRICWGNTGTGPGTSLASRVNEIVNGYYLSSFDSSHHVRDRYLPYGADQNDFTPWVEHTEEDPNCYRTFPEWDRTTEEGRLIADRWRTIKSLFGDEMTRTEVIHVTGTIPELPFAPTFGRAEEWARDLDATQRFRLLTALQNIQADNPADIVEPDEDDF
jgi:hypothetical protein